MSSTSFLVLVLVFIVTCSEAELATEFAEASDGGTASLPCNLTPNQPSDKVSVVVWHKGAEEDPIYKFDLRGNRPQHWAEPTLGDRFFLRILDDNRSVLTISPTNLSDENVYHCRVDFATSPSRITHVNLTIIVPPTGVQVSDDFGLVKNGITTSYAEGASLTLTCSATGGKPLARVSWWRDGKIVTDECQYFPERKKSQSLMKVEKLTRSHLLAVYSCEVSNSKLQPPLVVRVAIDMYLRPLEVTLIKEHEELSAGRRYNISCRCRGSRPPAIITWWKDGLSLEGGTVTVSADGNTTTSTLSFTPTSADHGLVLSCKASNHRIPFSEQQRTWMLRVLYPPKVTLNLGHGLDASDIKEGADVYFECHLVANPWVHRVWWLRDGERILSNATSGIIVSNQTLVLQGVSRSSSGRYCCEATNKEGTTKSTPFHLKVKFEPICGDGTGRKVLGAAKDEPLQVECKVDAEPVAKLFRWSFNSTPGISRELTEFTTDEGGSRLTYVPKIPADYGTLQCWGQNDIGTQRQPCTYHIVPAGKPDPPHTCQLSNVTHLSVFLSCKKGFDGGLKQRFTMNLSLGDNPVANMSSFTGPDFHITNLEPDKEYAITVSSYNSKGWSKPSDPINFRTLPAPGLNEQRRLMDPNGEGQNRSGPWLYITLAAGSTLIIAGTVVVIVFAVKRFRVDSPVRDRNPHRNPKQHCGEELPLDPRVPPLYTDALTDDNNPDLIPPTNESLLDSSLTPFIISARPSSKRNCATQMPVKPYHVTWAPILQSRNCSTQTPPPHKESSV
ncbi:nephrin-like isoform X3 [Coccinella septempunctata]|uniref:nephrin-like isoform X3 n=1 Tax=Coccinella septempunctata TaxID=41139 RepID=UPI001D072999|nr:nephrin-like isoform X3 [Coccinella septempunctata]